MILKIKYNKKTHMFYPMYKHHWWNRYDYFDEDCAFAWDLSRFVYGYKTYEEAFNVAKFRCNK